MTHAVTLLLVALCSFVIAQDVKVLTSQNFDQTTKGLWFVKFYAPWCGHCRNLSPTWDKLAQSVAGTSVNIGKIDCDQNSDVCSRFAVSGFPTLLLLQDGNKLVEYEGSRGVDAFVNFLSEATVEKKSKGQVVDLTSRNFDLLTSNPNTRWLIKFFAEWCGHCKALAPTWDSLAEEVKDSDIFIGSVDCTKEAGLCERYDVRGYPTIHYLVKPNKYTRYQNGRSFGQLVAFAKEGYKQSDLIDRPIPAAASFFTSFFSNPLNILFAAIVMFVIMLILVAICVCFIDMDPTPIKRPQSSTKPLITEKSDSFELPDVDPSEMDSNSVTTTVDSTQGGVDLKRRK